MISCMVSFFFIFFIFKIVVELTSVLSQSLLDSKVTPLYMLLLLLLPSRFSRGRLCATPWTAAHQAPPSLGFSRRKHWSGLPFPSPMHESEKGKWSVSDFSRVRLLATPWTAAYQAPPSMGFSRQEYWGGVPLPSLSVIHMCVCVCVCVCVCIHFLF